MTYGDGVANININEPLKFHKINKKATLTAVKPPSRFGALEINEDNLVSQFKEKPIGEKAWINGGFCFRTSSLR